MVAQQILRISVALSAALAVCWPLASSAQGEQPVTGEPVIVVDLRPEDSAQGASLSALLRGLRADPRVRAPTSAGAAAPDPAWKAFLDRATRALADLDCSKARKQSAAAITALATDHALGRPVRPFLTRAYAVWLRCAEPADAQLIVARLRKLGHESPPKGVSAEEWNAVPNVDAQAGVVVVATRVASTPTGASIFIDHQEMGVAPLEIALPPGRHLVTAVQGGRGATERLDASPPESKLDIQLPDRQSARSTPVQVAQQQWRGRSRPLSPAEVGKLLDSTGKRIALIVADSGQVQIWALPKDTRFARRVSAAPTNRPKYVAKLVNEWVQAEDGAGIDPSFPLMREDPNAKGKKKDEGMTTQWWVYAGVGAAVTFASVLILADQFASDRQRIELTLP